MAEQVFDMTKRFVRVINTLPGGLIEFEFSIGDPDVCVELVMPQTAFENFCQKQQAEIAPPQPCPVAESEEAALLWGIHQATHQRFHSR